MREKRERKKKNERGREEKKREVRERGGGVDVAGDHLYVFVDTRLTLAKNRSYEL